MKEKCIFCKISNGADEEYNRHVLDTENFFVIAGRGQFCKGYLLICPRRHVYNLGCLSEKEWKELSRVKQILKNKIKQTFGVMPVFFEHGDLDEQNRGGSCIDHAHLHVVPLELKQIPEFLKKFDLYRYNNSDLAKVNLDREKAYFYIETSTGEVAIIYSQFLPCQFGRQLLVKEFGLDIDWDWRKKEDREEMLETIKLYSDIAKKGA